MSLVDEPTTPEFTLTPDRVIASRMRFEDPSKFLEFYEKQLRQHVVGLRHPEAIAEGTQLLVIISPPGAPDQLQLQGAVDRVTPRSDGTVRLRVSVTPKPADTVWIEAYVAGLRAAGEWRAVTGADDNAAAAPREQVRQIAGRLDLMTYYQVLGVDPSVEPAELQTRFHELTRHFHPDLYHGLEDLEVRDAVNRVYRRMNEAYAVLRSSARRRAYDQGLTGPPHTWQLRLSEEEHERARRHERIRRGSTRIGDFYWTLAREILARARDSEHNIRPALRESSRLLRVALVFEPDNDHFRHALDQVLDRLAAPEV